MAESSELRTLAGYIEQLKLDYQGSFIDFPLARPPG
jgi:hypothetical protein